MAAVHDRARGHRSLLPAGRTFPAFSSQPLSWPQAGQTKPSGQRLAATERRRLHRDAPRRQRGTSGGRTDDRTLSEHSADGNRKPKQNIERTFRRWQPQTQHRQTGGRGISPTMNMLRTARMLAYPRACRTYGPRVRDSRRRPSVPPCELPPLRCTRQTEAG